MNPRFYIIMILPRLFPLLPASLLIFLCLLSDPSSRLEPRKSRLVMCFVFVCRERKLPSAVTTDEALLAGLDPSVFGE